MIIQDKKLNKNMEFILSQMVGCELNKIIHDEFTFTNSVYGKVSLFIGDKIFNILNQLEVVEYYGAKEDIAVLSIKQVEKDEVCSLLKDQKQIAMDVKEIIKSIDIVNYHIYVKVSTKEYDNCFTEGLIFNLGNIQVAFERSSSFIEMIDIYKGYDLISKFTDVSEYGDDFDNPAIVKTERNIVRINGDFC